MTRELPRETPPCAADGSPPGFDARSRPPRITMLHKVSSRSQREKRPAGYQEKPFHRFSVAGSCPLRDPARPLSAPAKTPRFFRYPDKEEHPRNNDISSRLSASFPRPPLSLDPGSLRRQDRPIRHPSTSAPHGRPGLRCPDGPWAEDTPGSCVRAPPLRQRRISCAEAAAFWPIRHRFPARKGLEPWARRR